MRPVFFSRLTVHRKATAILAIIVLPVVGLLILHLTAVRQLSAVQEQVNHIAAVQMLADEILALTVDVQYGFRGFVITRNEKFLKPLFSSEERLDPALYKLKQMVSDDPEQLQRVMELETRVHAHLQRKKQLVDAIRLGDMKSALEHIESGVGEAAHSRIRSVFDELEGLLKRNLGRQQSRAARMASLTQYGLAGVVMGALLLWWVGSRLLTRTVTQPITTLTAAAHDFGRGKLSQPIPIHSTDELGRLARTMEEMQHRISRHIEQLEAFHVIGKDVSTIGPDGLEGVLRRIAEQAGGVLNVDLCLVLLWEEGIGCWKVGAASGHWHDLLYRSVMVKEETPISFTALTTGTPQAFEDLRDRPETVLQIRDRLGGKSLLAVPLRGPIGTFGVLALAPTREKRAFTDWDVRLAQQFADLAAIAILNARLFETAQQRGAGLQDRLEQLERYSVDMAHDLKGPARRMAELASLLQTDYKGRFDERADRYLAWIRENGQQLMARIEEVLKLARIGIIREAVEPVDPVEVVRDVLKGCAEHIERQGARVLVADRFPKLACNRVHVFQVLDNLIRNALKFSAVGRSPEVEIGVCGTGHETVLFVRDNGIGIPPADLERVFEPFERLGHKDVTGTGVGLSIVKKIIELYQGRVWIESELEKGTTFFFALPLYGELRAADEVLERA